MKFQSAHFSSLPRFSKQELFLTVTARSPCWVLSTDLLGVPTHDIPDNIKEYWSYY